MTGEEQPANEAPASSEPRSFSLNGFSVVMAVLALAGALASLDFLPVGVGRLAGGLLFFVVAALPLLLRLSPTVPSVVKALTVSALCSPVLATTIYLITRLGLDAREAVALTFVLLGALQFLSLGRRVEHLRVGRYLSLAIALSVLMGALVWLLLFSGNAPRASYHGLLHSALLLAVDHSVPPAHPWMAGQELGYYWYWHAMGALFSRALFVAPTIGLALTNLWAAILLPLVLYLTAAPCFREGKREVFGVVLALFGLNALGGFVWWGNHADWIAPESPSALLEILRQAVGAWDVRLAFGFSKFGNLSSYPTSLTLLAGGLMCAAHAIRHGTKPWVGASAALHGAAFAVNPVVGGMGIASTALAFFLFAPGLRMRLILPIVVWALPGAWLTYLAGRSYAGESVLFQWSEGGFVATFAPVLLLMTPLLFITGAISRKGDASNGRHGRVLGLLLTAALLPLALHLFVLLPYANEYKLIRIAALPLGLLAAAGLIGMLESGGVKRVLGGALTLILLVGLVLTNGLGFAGYLAFSKHDLPLVEEPLLIAPRAVEGAITQSNELAWIYRWMSEQGTRAEEKPVLVVNCTSDTVPTYGLDRLARFTDTQRNLQGHEAAPFTGLELWCDRPSQVLSQLTPGWKERYSVLVRLYRGGGVLTARDQSLLFELDRPMLLLMTPSDRMARAGEDLRSVIEQLGFESVKNEGSTLVFAWPVDFAKTLRGRVQ
ncbi:MAG: hypothetical protein ACI8TQ_001540 [Planctomycetota bacterium]|jgi:hypothetical protein